jgi:hypothetical protein
VVPRNRYDEVTYVILVVRPLEGQREVEVAITVPYSRLADNNNVVSRMKEMSMDSMGYLTPVPEIKKVYKDEGIRS